MTAPLRSSAPPRIRSNSTRGLISTSGMMANVGCGSRCERWMSYACSTTSSWHWDLRHLPKDARQREANAIIHRQARIQMDMAEGPLFFARAIQMAADEHIQIGRA